MVRAKLREKLLNGWALKSGGSDCLKVGRALREKKGGRKGEPSVRFPRKEGGQGYPGRGWVRTTRGNGAVEEAKKEADKGESRGKEEAIESSHTESGG